MLTEKEKESFVKNSFWSMFVMLFNRIGSLIFVILLARLLLPEKYGIYSIILSIVMIFVTFSDLGINTALLRYCSGKKKEYYYNYLKNLKIKAVLICGGFFLLIAYPLSVYYFKNENLSLAMIVSSIYMITYSFECFFSGLFITKEKNNYLALKEFIGQTLKIILCFFALVFLKNYNRVALVFIVLTFVSLIGLFIFHIFNKFVLKIKGREGLSKEEKEEVRNFIYGIALISISGLVFNYVDSLMLGYFLKPEFVGFYKIAFSLIVGITGLFGFSHGVLIQTFTKIGKIKSGRITEKMNKYLLILIVPAIAALIILGKYFIVLLFGYEYLDAYFPLIILAFAIFPMTLGILAGPFFVSLGRTKEFSRLMIISMILYILLAIFLIKMSVYFFSENQIYATMAVAFSLVLSQGYYMTKTLNKISETYKIKFNIVKLLSKPIMSSFVMSIVIYYLLRYFGDINIINGGIICLSGVIVYFVVLFVIKGITKEDILILRYLARKEKFGST